MTEPTDIDALVEAKAKLRHHAMRRDLGAMPRHIHTVLDALEQSQAERDEARKSAEDHVLDAEATYERLSAELRQERERADQAAAELADVFRVDIPSLRERADELEANLALAGVTVSEMLSALFRAEETIEKALEIRRTSSLTSAEMVYKMFRVLTEYNKQKEQK